MSNDATALAHIILEIAVCGAKQPFASGDRKGLGLGIYIPPIKTGFFEEQIQCIIVLHL